MPTQGKADLIAAYLGRRAELVRFFTLRLHSAGAAEDLVQDIYLRLSASEPQREIDNPVGYLYRLGSNLMLDRLRGERRAVRRDSAWREAHRTIAGAEEVAEDPSPDAVVSSRQRLASILEALRELPPQTQAVFRLHKLQGLSHAEVAARLGVSRSAVEKHMSLALKRLLAALPQ